MSARLTARVATPIVIVSLLPLSAGIISAWHVHRLQTNTSQALAYNVRSMRAAEELVIAIRDARTHLDRFLLTGDPQYLDALPKIRHETDYWLAESDRAAVVPKERELIARVRRGYDPFFQEMHRITQQVLHDPSAVKSRGLIDDVFTNEILLPAQEYLDYNEEEIAKSSEENQQLSRQLVPGLLFLGTSVTIAGILVGFGIARGITRSIVRLSLPVRDAAGKLHQLGGPITLSADWGLAELEGVLQTIASHIETIVRRWQQSEREALRAEQLAKVGQLAAGFAHELRNPLMAMKILVQAAVDHGADGKLAGRDLAVLEEEILRLERLTQTFLDFARPPQLEKRPFVIQHVLQQTLDLLSSRAEQQQVRLESEMPRAPLQVTADRGQIRQVLLNLLLNALDAVPNGGRVLVRLNQQPVRADEGRARGAACWLAVEVADSGCGLPADLGLRIFEPFISTKTTGMGLGLSISRRIAEAHGGDLSAANRPEGGAVFTVRLPWAEQPTELSPARTCGEATEALALT